MQKHEREITAEEFSRFRVEMTRRELMALLSKVETGTNTGLALQHILEEAIDKVEELAEMEAD